MKFGGIVQEVKILIEFSTTGATYSFTELVSQNVLKAAYFIILINL